MSQLHKDKSFQFSNQYESENKNDYEHNDGEKVQTRVQKLQSKLQNNNRRSITFSKQQNRPKHSSKVLSPSSNKSNQNRRLQDRNRNSYQNKVQVVSNRKYQVERHRGPTIQVPLNGPNSAQSHNFLNQQKKLEYILKKINVGQEEKAIELLKKGKDAASEVEKTDDKNVTKYLASS